MTNFGQSLADFGTGVAMNAGQTGVQQRVAIKWEVPWKPNQAIEMYVNPENINIQSKKILQKHLTRGGFVVQYWGEDFDRAMLTGTTGSGGIEAINILKDIYRSEQKAIESTTQSLIDAARTGSVSNIAQTAGGELNKSVAGSSIGAGIKRNVINTASGQDTSIGQSNYLGLSDDDIKSSSYELMFQSASLARRAMNIWMHYQGISYRGYFEDFQVTESVDKLGLFTYTINFTIIDSIGSRVNFMPWHRNPELKAPGPLSYSGQLNKGLQNQITGSLDKFNYGVR